MVKKKDAAHNIEHPEELHEKIGGQADKIDEGLERMAE
jgi:hypothetical protein